MPNSITATQVGFSVPPIGMRFISAWNADARTMDTAIGLCKAGATRAARFVRLRRDDRLYGTSHGAATSAPGDAGPLSFQLSYRRQLLCQRASVARCREHRGRLRPGTDRGDFRLHAAGPALDELPVLRAELPRGCFELSQGWPKVAASSSRGGPLTSARIVLAHLRNRIAVL